MRSRLRASELILLCFLLWLTFCLQVFSQKLKELRPFDYDIEIPEDEFSPPSLKDECLDLDSATLRELGSVTCDAPASSPNLTIDRTGNEVDNPITAELDDVHELGSVTCDAPASSPNLTIDRTGNEVDNPITAELDDVHVQLGQIRAPTGAPSSNSTTLFIYEPQGLTFPHGQNFAFDHFQLPRPSEETQVLRGMRALPQRINRQQQQQGSDTLNGGAQQQIVNIAERLTRIALWFGLSGAVAFSVYALVMYPWNKVEPVLGYFALFATLFGFGIYIITGRTTSLQIFVREMTLNIITFLITFRRSSR